MVSAGDHELVAVVTGGASGIGRATAGLLAARGATVISLDHTHRPDDPSEPAAGKVARIAFDVREWNNLTPLLDDLESRGFSATALVNNAAILDLGPAIDLEVDRLRLV
ncbi:SDR family NAD(P)-dependent oxidoreductase [Parafrankia sp. FMc2]|uniref:SDR family NAD(P)-dependent oxidoreductase n=1 Tax=Parafrankia sp. FMc2 TaxID=3233196 RepID=UPI0034D4DAFB